MINERIYNAQSRDEGAKIESANKRASLESKEHAIKSLNKALEEALRNMTNEEISKQVEEALAGRKREILQ